MRIMLAAAAMALSAGGAAAQTTASGQPVAGAPIGTTGTPRAGTGIPNQETGGAGGAAPAQAPAAAGGIPATAAPVVVPGAARPVAAGVAAMNDNLFAVAAAGSGLSEVALGRLAVERAAGPEVKAFAQQMIADHTRANTELMTLAAARQLPLPTTLPPADLAAENALMGETGPEFDRCYAGQQHAAHICAVALFEAEAKRGTDPQIKAWAAKTLPIIKQHKEHAKRLHEQLEAQVRGAAPAAAH